MIRELRNPLLGSKKRYRVETRYAGFYKPPGTSVAEVSEKSIRAARDWFDDPDGTDTQTPTSRWAAAMEEIGDELEGLLDAFIRADAQRLKQPSIG